LSSVYELTKKFVQAIIPKKVLSRNETFIRRLVSSYYIGTKYECNICNKRLRKFIKLDRGDLLCPFCGSLPRTRGLYKFIDDKLVNKTVLHFSPPKCLKNKILETGETNEYITSDFEDEFEADLALNIENIDQPDGKYNVIICYHVLEHIGDDSQALRELNRITKKEGICIIQTPFKEGDIYENPAITNPTERLKHFGQKDHLRIYSPNGLEKRMKEVGFKTEIIVFENEADNYNGLKENDTILIGKKDVTTQPLWWLLTKELHN